MYVKLRMIAMWIFHKYSKTPTLMKSKYLCEGWVPLKHQKIPEPMRSFSKVQGYLEKKLKNSKNSPDGGEVVSSKIHFLVNFLAKLNSF